jgi:hypothetical protein
MSRLGNSHQSILPLLNAACAENSSKVKNSTRSKYGTLGPEVKPGAPPLRGRYCSKRAKAALAPPLTCSLLRKRKGPLPTTSFTGWCEVAASRSGMIAGTVPPVPASASGRCGKGRFNRNFTVRSSAADSSSVAAIKALANGTRTAKRRILATTSFANTGSLSWKRSPSRRRSSQVSPSSSTSCPSTICGSACRQRWTLRLVGRLSA